MPYDHSVPYDPFIDPPFGPFAFRFSAAIFEVSDRSGASKRCCLGDEVGRRNNGGTSERAWVVGGCGDVFRGAFVCFWWGPIEYPRPQSTATSRISCRGFVYQGWCLVSDVSCTESKFAAR